MQIIGRYENIRFLGAGGWDDQSYILDRKQGLLLPYEKDRWWQSPEGVWVPVSSGGSVDGYTQRPNLTYGFTGNMATGPAAVNLDLDSAYTAGSAGDAIATRLMLREAKTLTDVYFYVPSYGGTAANVTSLNVEVRAAASAILPDTSAPGLLASASLNPASATGWLKFSGLSVALSAGLYYWIIIADANGGATDFARVTRSVTNLPSTSDVIGWAALTSAQTTGGWASGNTNSSAIANSVLKFSDGSVIGWPWATTVLPTNNALQMGLYTDGFATEHTVHVVAFGTAISTVSGVNIWEGTSGPTGTAAYTSSAVLHATTATNITGAMFAPNTRLRKNTPYRIQLTKSGNAARPQKIQIGAGADATIRAAKFGGANTGWSEENTGPGWTDDMDAWPFMAIGVENQFAGQALQSLTGGMRG